MTEAPPPADPTGPARPTRRARRRGAAESLLSIVLVLEAMSLFFVMLVVNGRDLVPPGVAFGGGLGAIVLVLLVSRTLRWRWGIALGWVVQLGLVACGLLDPVMYVVAALFVAIWTYCLVKGTQLDRMNAARFGPQP
ncbi:DUF4233 domain-containing protein [Frigoribacterium sp. CFBP 13729]|uniref:DUF4233 domain-containing protein n=1 Tax=unclassified Frigoribacterium TaxID=2627005 RepID=UPI001787386B|nr:DUF4233 domain-containing protein [Frigoribacterium sp. CFBP 8766]MBD8610754.1 DUF4233 domain-containing protein [Frigoribacterium sp. CFBP 13729]